MPPAPQFPLPPSVRLADVRPGDSAAGEAGAILHVVGTATASLTGDDAGLFGIDGIETLELVKDPDAPARSWETVSEADGPGPVDGGPAFGVKVRFTCPDPPARETFAAAAVLTVSAGGTSVTHGFPVTATVLPENLEVQFDPPAFFRGEEQDLTVTISSTYRRDVAGLLSFSSDQPGAFSFGKLVSAITVPRLGTASVTVPVKATAAVTGDYDLTVAFQPDDTAAPAADTRTARILGHRAVTVTSTFASQLTLFHPSKTPGFLNATVDSDGPVTVFFELIGIPETVSLTLPPSVTVDAKAAVGIDIVVSSSLTAFTDAFAPITIAWLVPADDFHPEELRGSFVLSEVSLPMRVVTVPSGELSDGTVSGSATLVIQQDGFVNYQGHVHNDGLLGGNYLMAIWFPDARDDQGNTVTFIYENRIAGTLGGGDSRDGDWDVSGPSDPALKQLIIDTFGQFDSSPEANLQFESDLRIDLETLFLGTLADLGIAAIIVYLPD